MILARNQKILLATTALLLASLACRTATRLIIPDTPTPVPTSTATLIPTATPTLTPTVTPTLESAASCPSVLSQIINDATARAVIVASDDTTVDKEVEYLVHYTVVGDELKTPLFNSIPNDLKAEQDDHTTQTEIWNYFTRLIPSEQRELITGFSIITDGRFQILAGVEQADKNPYKWNLNVDIADAKEKTSLTFTLLHEFGHLLTLNSNQVEVNVSLYHHPNDEDLYQSAVAACPQYFTGEGCSNPDSYMNVFFDRFWTDFYSEWQAIDEQADKDTRLNMLDDFYNTYQDQFLTDYAPTSPEEDIAESWAFFILAPKPEANSIANEKIRFFYEYPELVQLRMQILDKICVEFPS